MPDEPRQIYVVVSAKQNECTICNRWFDGDQYAQAWAYCQQVEKETGCAMQLYAIDKFQTADLAQLASAPDL